VAHDGTQRNRSEPENPAIPRNRAVSAHSDQLPDGIDNVSYAPGAYDTALKDGARVASPNNAAGEGPGRTNVMAVPTCENLERLARLLDAGTVKVPIHETTRSTRRPPR
jgi:hypothetical protein